MIFRFSFCLILIVVSFFIQACVNKSKSKIDLPKNTLVDSVFIRVLAEFAMAESAANLNINNVAIQKIDSVYSFNPLKENKIRQMQFDSTLKFYANHPELYKLIYEEVIIYLTNKESKRVKKE